MKHTSINRNLNVKIYLKETSNSSTQLKNFLVIQSFRIADFKSKETASTTLNVGTRTNIKESLMLPPHPLKTWPIIFKNKSSFHKLIPPFSDPGASKNSVRIILIYTWNSIKISSVHALKKDRSSHSAMNKLPAISILLPLKLIQNNQNIP